MTSSLIRGVGRGTGVDDGAPVAPIGEADGLGLALSVAGGRSTIPTITTPATMSGSIAARSAGTISRRDELGAGAGACSGGNTGAGSRCVCWRATRTSAAPVLPLTERTTGGGGSGSAGIGRRGGVGGPPGGASKDTAGDVGG